MTDHRSQRALLRGPNIECPDGAINAGCCQDCRTVFVPIVCEYFIRRGGSWWDARLTGDGGWSRGVVGDLDGEVVRGGSGGAQVKDTHV